MVEDQIKEEQTISLAEIFIIIKKYFFFLVLTTLVGALILGVYAFQIAVPKYRSTGEILVEVLDSQDNANTLESTRRITSAMDMVKSSLVINKVQEIIKASEQNLEISAQDLRDNITVRNVTNSQIFSVGYTSTDADLAQFIAQVLIETIINETAEFATFKDNLHNVSVAQEAEYVSPNKLLLVIVGALVGGVIGLVVVFIGETVTSGFKSREELERATNTIVLGAIPMFTYRGEKYEEE